MPCYTIIMRKDIEGAAFDLDGTLYPNYRLHIKLLPFVLTELPLISAFGQARNKIRREQEIVYRFMISSVTLGKSAMTQNPPNQQGGFYKRQAEIAAQILNVPAQELEEKIDRLIYKGWEPLFKEIKLFDHVEATLAALRQAGYKTGLLSDFPPVTKLENLGISGLWDAVLCSEQSGALKPHPRSFTELADAMALPPGKILFVGNSRPYDVVGAKRAGMKTAWIKSPLFPGRGFKQPLPDFSFSNYRQLYHFMLS